MGIPEGIAAALVRARLCSVVRADAAGGGVDELSLKVGLRGWGVGCAVVLRDGGPDRRGVGRCGRLRGRRGGWGREREGVLGGGSGFIDPNTRIKQIFLTAH